MHIKRKAWPTASDVWFFATISCSNEHKIIRTIVRGLGSKAFGVNALIFGFFRKMSGKYRTICPRDHVTCLITVAWLWKKDTAFYLVLFKLFQKRKRHTYSNSKSSAIPRWRSRSIAIPIAPPQAAQPMLQGACSTADIPMRTWKSLLVPWWQAGSVASSSSRLCEKCLDNGTTTLRIAHHFFSRRCGFKCRGILCSNVMLYQEIQKKSSTAQIKHFRLYKKLRAGRLGLHQNVYANGFFLEQIGFRQQLTG